VLDETGCACGQGKRTGGDHPAPQSAHPLLRYEIGDYATVEAVRVGARYPVLGDARRVRNLVRTRRLELLARALARVQTIGHTPSAVRANDIDRIELRVVAVVH
jgi:hypothetical protein